MDENSLIFTQTNEKQTDFVVSSVSMDKSAYLNNLAQDDKRKVITYRILQLLISTFDQFLIYEGLIELLSIITGIIIII